MRQKKMLENKILTKKNEEVLNCQWVWLKGKEIEKKINKVGKMKNKTFN